MLSDDDFIMEKFTDYCQTWKSLDKSLKNLDMSVFCSIGVGIMVHMDATTIQSVFRIMVVVGMATIMVVLIIVHIHQIHVSKEW